MTQKRSRRKATKPVEEVKPQVTEEVVTRIEDGPQSEQKEVLEAMPCYCNNQYSQLQEEAANLRTEVLELRHEIQGLKREIQSKSDFIKHQENSISVKEEQIKLQQAKADRYYNELNKVGSFGRWIYGINN
jgi:predicted  nucleic acid-binding Zn-ribbon protein